MRSLVPSLKTLTSRDRLRELNRQAATNTSWATNAGPYSARRVTKVVRSRTHEDTAFYDDHAVSCEARLTGESKTPARHSYSQPNSITYSPHHV